VAWFCDDIKLLFSKGRECLFELAGVDETLRYLMPGRNSMIDVVHKPK
jgi:hypothetical protein